MMYCAIDTNKSLSATSENIEIKGMHATSHASKIQRSVDVLII